MYGLLLDDQLKHEGKQVVVMDFRDALHTAHQLKNEGLQQKVQVVPLQATLMYRGRRVTGKLQSQLQSVIGENSMHYFIINTNNYGCLRSNSNNCTVSPYQSKQDIHDFYVI